MKTRQQLEAALRDCGTMPNITSDQQQARQGAIKSVRLDLIKVLDTELRAKKAGRPVEDDHEKDHEKDHI